MKINNGGSKTSYFKSGKFSKEKSCKILNLSFAISYLIQISRLKFSQDFLFKDFWAETFMEKVTTSEALQP